MKRNLALSVVSVVTIFLITVHLADDVVFGFEDGRRSYLVVAPILGIWLYAALMVSERRWACVVTLLLVALLRKSPLHYGDLSLTQQQLPVRQAPKS